MQAKSNSCTSIHPSIHPSMSHPTTHYVQQARSFPGPSAPHDEQIDKALGNLFHSAVKCKERLAAAKPLKAKGVVTNQSRSEGFPGKGYFAPACVWCGRQAGFWSCSLSGACVFGGFLIPPSRPTPPLLVCGARSHFGSSLSLLPSVCYAVALL